MRSPVGIEPERRSHLIDDPLMRLGVEMVAGISLGAVAGLWLVGSVIGDPLLSAAVGAAIGGAVGASLFGLDGE